jgi:hypothetical protein
MFSHLAHRLGRLGCDAGDEAREVARGLGVFGLLLAGWTLMAVAVSPVAHWRNPARQTAQVPPPRAWAQATGGAVNITRCDAEGCRACAAPTVDQCNRQLAAQRDAGRVPHRPRRARQ